MSSYEIFEFQFHKGTIKTIVEGNYRFAIQHFNSIKVRLKPNTVLISAGSLVFQFHKGTIKT